MRRRRKWRSSARSRRKPCRSRFAILPSEALEPAAARFLAGEARRGVFIQYILYEPSEVLRFDGLLDRGVVPAQGASQLFVLGRYTPGQTSRPADLLPFLTARSNALPWSLCAFGPREAACALAAATLDGHARVGFENNLRLPDGTPAPNNAALVDVVARAARTIGFSTATPDEARRIFAHG